MAKDVLLLSGTLRNVLDKHVEDEDMLVRFPEGGLEAWLRWAVHNSQDSEEVVFQA